MGKWMNIFATCLGLGIAAGAGFYLYRKFTSDESEESETENSVQQDGAIKEDDSSNEDIGTEVLPSEGQSDHQAKLEDSSDGVKDETKYEVEETLDKPTEVTPTSPQNDAEKTEKIPASTSSEETQKTKKEKKTFGGLRKGFLL